MAETKQYDCGIAGQIVTLSMGNFGFLGGKYGVVDVLCPYAEEIPFGCKCIKQDEKFHKENPSVAYVVECGLYHKRI